MRCAEHRSCCISRLVGIANQTENNESNPTLVSIEHAVNKMTLNPNTGVAKRLARGWQTSNAMCWIQILLCHVRAVVVYALLAVSSRLLLSLPCLLLLLLSCAWYRIQLRCVDDLFRRVLALLALPLAHSPNKYEAHTATLSTLTSISSAESLSNSIDTLFFS